MKNLTNCNFNDANIAFFPMTKKSVIASIIEPILLGTCRILGYLYIPSPIAELLKRYSWAKHKICIGGHPLCLKFFNEDFDEIPLCKRERYISECHDEIMRICQDSRWPNVWVFGNQKLLEEIAIRILIDPVKKDSDSIQLPIYFHTKIQNCKFYALLVGEEGETPEPILISEKSYLAILN